jgi:hypothetical protein
MARGKVQTETVDRSSLADSPNGLVFHQPPFNYYFSSNMCIEDYIITPSTVTAQKVPSDQPKAGSPKLAGTKRKHCLVESHVILTTGVISLLELVTYAYMRAITNHPNLAGNTLQMGVKPSLWHPNEDPCGMETM